MDEYRGYLKNALAVEKTVVSYRLLSRALKVHVNQAKEMLYDFYTSENTRKSKSVHATYIVTGYRKPPPSTKVEEVGGSDDDDNDTIMFDSSLPGTQATVTAEEEEKTALFRVVELCQEEELDSAKAGFEKVLSVHLYSIEQMPLEDFSILTGCCAELLLIHQKEDPLKMGATYGTITNPNATRTSSRAPPPLSVSKEATMSVGKERRKEEAPVKKEAVAKEAKSEKDDKPEVRAEKKPATKTATFPVKKTAPPAAKRSQSNDFFNSWKTVPKKATAGSASEPSSAAPSPNVEEEPSMRMGSDSDDDDEANDQQSLPAYDNTEDVRKRREKEEELKNMMEDGEEGEEGDSPLQHQTYRHNHHRISKDNTDIEMQDDEPPAKMAKIEDSPEPEQSTRIVTGVKTSGGRVRARRKVSKQVQSRDEEGYLVTKTEYVWESFSEDEPEPPKPKPALKPATKGKRSKDDQSKGKVNLMTYFAKK